MAAVKSRLVHRTSRSPHRPVYRLRANLREDKGTRSIADIMPSERITAARDLVQGLTGHEAAKRLALDGTNELNSERPRTLAKIAMEVLAEPMFVLLLAACGIYVLLGDFREALALSASIVVIVVITLLQERRTEQTLSRLRDLSSPRALVIRDGIEQRIAGREIVAGDVVLLHEGDRVPADAVVHQATALFADESILTGESLPVEKHALAPQGSVDASNRVSAGTLIVHGYGLCVVDATGMRSDLGRIGQSLQSMRTQVAPIYIEVRRVVRWVAIAALALCTVIAVGYSITRGDWLGGVLAGITVAMGVLPEEFPVVLTIFLAMGAWRISRVGVLVRRMPAIESMGAVTVLCVDKTGTLTENRMRVAVIDSLRSSIDLRHTKPAELEADSSHALLIAAAASEVDAFDPMERAIHEACHSLAPQAAAWFSDRKLVREYDLTSTRPMVAHVWRSSQDEAIVAVKGAPEAVLRQCHLDPSSTEALLAKVTTWADQGLRVLAVAEGSWQAGDLPDEPETFALQLLGFIGIADPLRQDVPAALEMCRSAAIRVAMITGDHPGTASAIAREAGFDLSGGTLTGAEVDALDDTALRERVRRINVFARMRPQQKLRLVQAMQANGELVAMTGDGVNDAPALKAADVGVAMGRRGTDVAREAASIVLVNDDFSSLVAAVRLGRRIYDNTRHAMTYLVAVHIPIAGLGLLPVIFGWPLLFFPLQVVFLEFVIDPACAFVFEADPAAKDIMRRPPRPRAARLFDRATLIGSSMFGIVVLCVCTAAFAIALRHMPQAQARALTFVMLVSANLTLIFVTRTRTQTFGSVLERPNPVFWTIITLTATALAIVVFVDDIAALFYFRAPPVWLAIAAGTCVAILVLTAALAQRSLLRARQRRS